MCTKCCQIKSGADSGLTHLISVQGSDGVFLLETDDYTPGQIFLGSTGGSLGKYFLG